MSKRVALLVAVAVGAITCTTIQPAHAVTDRWSTWAPLTGSSNAYTTTMQQASPGFPAATVASDSRAPAQVAGGSSAVLGPGTPPGNKYGTSAGNPYLLLRPRADTATAPSTTTYTFDAPTPDTGWAFVLGDIDADQVRVTATDAEGVAVPAAEVDSWFAGSFNYASGGTDVPTWDAGTSTLTGNAGAADTDGASGWFEPDVPLTGLTLTFTRRAGFPVYQTWFVSRARPIGGTVTDLSTGGCPPTQATMTLLSPSGATLATTTPAADGTYSFGELATQAGYTVRLDVPDTCAVVGVAEETVSNRGNDNDPASRADFSIRAVIPQAISGTVRSNTGPVAGVLVTLTAPGGATFTTTTGADGTYLFDNNATANGYSVSIALPDGYSPGPGGTTISGIDVGTAPVTGQDFTLADLPSVSGTVRGGGTGIGAVEVVLTPVGGGTPITTATLGDGSYVIDDLAPGDYTLSVVAPSGFTAPPPVTITVPVGGLTGQDVQLERPGALGGTVTRDGVAVAGVRIVVDGPGGPRVLSTDADGGYYLDQLGPGTYTITITAPDGTVVVGPSTRTVTITAAGEVRGGQDFALGAAPPTSSPSPSPTATATATATPTKSPSDDDTKTPGPTPTNQGDNQGDNQGGNPTTTAVLPDTGGPSVGLAAGALALVVGGLTLIAIGRRRDRARG